MRTLFFLFCFFPIFLAAQPKVGVITVRKTQQINFFIDIKEIPEYSNGSLEAEISKLIRYPKNVSAEGIVVVYCIVDKTGEVTHAEVKKGVHPELDKEAVRLIYSLKKFKPYTKNEKLYDVRFEIPIQFSKK
jgi:periplasmic protein TonB